MLAALLVGCSKPRLQPAPTAPPPVVAVEAHEPASPTTPEACTAMLVSAEGPASTEAERSLSHFGHCWSIISKAHYAPGARALVVLLEQMSRFPTGDIPRDVLVEMPDEAEPFVIEAIEQKQLGSVERMVLANLLGNFSRRKGRDAVLRVLERKLEDTERRRLMASLYLFPHEKKTVEAYTRSYAKLTNGGDEELAYAADFFDPSLVSWLLRVADAAHDVEHRSAAIQWAIVLMTPSQVDAVGDAVDDLPENDRARTVFDNANALLERCRTNAHCYVETLREPTKETRTKAAWMAGIFGNRDTRSDLVALVPRVLDSSARSSMLLAILHLAPQGDAAAAVRLDQIPAAQRSFSGGMTPSDPLYAVALVLRSRATQPP